MVKRAAPWRISMWSLSNAEQRWQRLQIWVVWAQVTGRTTGERLWGRSMDTLRQADGCDGHIAMWPWRVGRVFDALSIVLVNAVMLTILAVLPYAYLQLQQIWGQIISYQQPRRSTNKIMQQVPVQMAINSRNQTNEIAPEPFERFGWVGTSALYARCWSHDPTLSKQPKRAACRVYFADERLIRRQYSSMDGGRDSVSFRQVCVAWRRRWRWRFHLPDPSDTFPNAKIIALQTPTAGQMVEIQQMRRPEVETATKRHRCEF